LLAKFAPDAIKFFVKKKNVAEAASAVVETAKRITGADSEDAIVRAMENDPELLKSFLTDVQISLNENETKRFETYHETLRREIASTDRFCRWMRPVFGYSVAAQVNLLIILIFTVVFKAVFWGGDLNAIGDAIAKISGLLFPVLSIELAVLGVYIKKRSDDKQLNAGFPRTGLIDVLRGAIKNR